MSTYLFKAAGVTIVYDYFRNTDADQSVPREEIEIFSVYVKRSPLDLDITELVDEAKIMALIKKDIKERTEDSLERKAEDRWEAAWEKKTL